MGDTTVRAQVIIEAKDQTGSATGSAAKGMGDLNKSMADMVKQATGLDLSSVGLAGAIVGVGVALKGSLDKAAAWGDEMGDLSTKTGMTVEQASTMATVFGDVGLSMGTLEAAAKSAAKNGLEFNMDTLKRLSAQYQAIESPVERSQFAMKNFGRAGLEMTEILARSSDNLDELARAAQRSGKVIGEDAAQAAEEFNTKMKQLEDRTDGLKVAIGNALIPTLTAAADGFMNLVNGIQDVQTALKEHAAQVALSADTYAEYAAEARRAQLAAGDLYSTTGILTEAQWEQTQAQAAVDAQLVKLKEDSAVLAPIVDISAAAFDGLTVAQEDADAAANALVASMDKQGVSAASLAGGLKELTTQTLFNQAAAGLDADAALALGLRMGVVDKAAAEAAGKIQELKNKYDTNRDGAISAAEAARGYTAEVLALAKSVDMLQDKVVTVKVNVEGDVGQLVTSSANGNRNTRRGGGGPIYAGQATIVGDAGPELVMLTGGGGTVTPLGATNAGGLPVVQSSTDPDVLNLLRGMPGMIRRAFQDAMAGA